MYYRCEETELERKSKVTINILIASAIGAVIASVLANVLSGIIAGFLPSEWITNSINDADSIITTITLFSYLHGLLGYGIAGILFGYGLWQLFRQSSTIAVMYSPGFMIFYTWIQSYLNLSDQGREATFSPYQIVGMLLTSSTGFYMLIVIPAAAIMTIWYMRKNISPNMVNT